MRPRAIGRTGIYFFLAGLASCYAQVEDTDVAYVQSNICGTGSGCVGNNTSLNLSSNLTPPISLDLGNAGVLTDSQSKQGPITFKGGLVLTQTIVAMTTPDNGNFNGLRTVDLRAAVGSDSCTQLSATCQSIASYDSTRDGTAQKRLVLRGTGANLSELAGPSKKLAVYVRATGNAPAAPTWNADLELDLAIKARGGFP